MKKVLLIFLVVFLFFDVNGAFAHQLIFSDGMNTEIDVKKGKIEIKNLIITRNNI